MNYFFKGSSESPVPVIVDLSHFLIVIVPIGKYIFSDSPQLLVGHKLTVFDMPEFGYPALTLEYLAGHWESYWSLSTNFITYHSKDVGAAGYKLYFVEQDFNQTWFIFPYIYV
ncbi:hypothetical protein BCR32DRAFT_283642 [Anaeromyces robustus]|uniref:Uncharacterized protein n=1 Tax=Anaeromyces robustus TaxID=1754192 RepID=A0A1Y1WUU3_9FUNG|nr:hypothetical protein BCR32DRAFT_283642 [Anaeromyces robustus]|eukprot:ORX76976.1 hypothetical protein BCR32DRAFT_283642 [Anaeromyces robustus]